MGLGRAELSFTVLDPVKLPAATTPRWAVLGRSNVGKSSFLNALLHPHSLFRTGRTPGLTTGLIGAKVHLGKSPESVLELVDLPGFGYAQSGETDRERWTSLADTLRTQSEDMGLHWVWLVDPTRSPSDDETKLLGWLKNAPYSLVFTKADRVKRGQREKVLRDWSKISQAATEGPYWVSSTDGEGFQEIFKSARNYLRSVHETRKRLAE